MNEMAIVLCTGGFDPIHSGHLVYLEEARKLGAMLFVGLNSDEWLTRKKGKPFMPFEERKRIMAALSCVDGVIGFDDSDNTAKDAIRFIRETFPQHHIIFANGGDRTAENIPEMSCGDKDISFVFGVGGNNKKNSSSWILDKWDKPKVERQWGYWRVTYDVPHCKVKELVVNAHKSLSMQRHSFRSELWFVKDGMCEVASTTGAPVMLVRGQSHTIPRYSWHQLRNPFDNPCTIIEIQYGDHCVEEDIERQDEIKAA